MHPPHRGDGPSRRRSGDLVEVTVHRHLTPAHRREIEQFLLDHGASDDHLVPDHVLADLHADALSRVITAHRPSGDGPVLVGCALLATSPELQRLAVAAPADTAAALVERALAERLADLPMQWWIHGVPSPLETLATEHGFAADRELIQMTCDLPIATTATLPTRGFEPGRDEDAWLSLNNRAFVGHGEQAGWNRETLRRRMDTPWFDPVALRILELDDEMAGFCWTKIHTELQPVTGEIYVIAVDPRLHGRGLGREMTCAGLDWLTARGITRAMLFVDGTNQAARTLYRDLGFTTARRDRSYVHPPGGFHAEAPHSVPVH